MEKEQQRAAKGRLIALIQAGHSQAGKLRRWQVASHESVASGPSSGSAKSACQSLRALHVGSDPASSAVAHEDCLDFSPLFKNCAALIYSAALGLLP
jgi:hypothetical protein